MENMKLEIMFWAAITNSTVWLASEADYAAVGAIAYLLLAMFVGGIQVWGMRSKE